MAFVFTGNEVQVDSFGWVIHDDMDRDEEIDKIEARLRKVFEGESAHLLTRVLDLRHDLSASYFASRGNLDMHIENLRKHVEEEHQKATSAKSGGFPISMRFMNFLTYTPLEVVKGSTP